MKQYHPTLDAIRFCPNCGKPFRTEHCGNHTECPECGFVLFFNAAAAVAVLLRDAGGRLLLTRRAKEPAKGKLAFPGGFADIFETPEEAACRELAEECGITLPPEKMNYFYSDSNRYRYRDVTYVSQDLYFTAEVADFSEARALDESAGIVCLRPEKIDLAEISFDSARNALVHFMDLQQRERTKHISNLQAVP